MTYDLNWSLKGGEVIDFYVLPLHRGHGAALLLTIGMAKETQLHGGTFLKGGSANPVVNRTFERIAMRQPDGALPIGARFQTLCGAVGKKSARDYQKPSRRGLEF